MAGVSDWSAVADENTTVDGINIAEHCPAKNINNAIRSVMAALKNKCDALDSTDNTLRRGAVIGEIRWFAMPTPPEGWLACNGAEVLISDYPALYNAIGTLFLPKGVRDAPGMFFLPNLMGKVPWGATSVGTAIDAGLPDISGHFSATDNVCLNGYADKDTPKVFGNNDGCFSFIDGSGGRALVNVIQVGNYSDNRRVTFSASSSNNIYGNSDTVQPPALCLLPCIRYE
jgi:hypothetical protein